MNLPLNGRTAEVVGDWQVVVVKSPNAGTVRTQDGKFGARSVTLSTFTFPARRSRSTGPPNT